MKRYRFPLDTVLRVRQIEQDIARAGLVDAQQTSTSADAELHQTVDRYRSLPTGTGSESAQRWLARRSVGQLTAASVMAAGTNSEHARLLVDERRAALRAARMRTSALERLDERHRDEHDLESRRAEERDVDELVTARHGRTSS